MQGTSPILFAFLALFFIYTLASILFSTVLTKKDSHKKAKVFFLTFVVPVLIGLLILFLSTSGKGSFTVYMAAGLILGILIRIATNRRKYLVKFQVEKDHLNLEYLTPFIKTKKIVLQLDEVSGFEITRANFLAEYPAAITFKYKNAWQEFQFIDKRLKTEIAEQVNAFNKSITASEATG